MKRHGWSAEDLARGCVCWQRERCTQARTCMGRARRVDWPVALGWGVYLVLVIVGAVALVWG